MQCNLKKYRKLASIGSQEMADHLGITRSAWSICENKKPFGITALRILLIISYINEVINENQVTIDGKSELVMGDIWKL